MADDIFLGAKAGGEAAQHLLLKRANRHGLIAGATGTGKTVTLQGLAEGFSRAGVPVFLADVKGDLAGMAVPGSAQAKAHESLAARARDLGIDPFTYADNPVLFWDLYGQQGHPVRTTVSEMGPLLLARLFDLNETQTGVLNIAFRAADDEGLLLLDLKDLRQMLVWCADNARELSASYGNISRQSIGAIQRQLLNLEAQGGEFLFGEPALTMTDMIAHAPDGRGWVNILAADKLMASPRLYATFLLWMLTELFEELPEVGDPDKPVLVFFFDEAHLLFDDAPKVLVDKVEQVVRLIRSKGVGVYFVTQNPIDIPDGIAGQLGNRIQHALRAYTPREQKSVKAAAATFRPNPEVDVATAITELKTGEALVSLLQADGAPSMVERVLIRPPVSRLGPITTGERAVIIAASPIAGRYDEVVDRESAFELLSQKAADAAEVEAAAEAEAQARKDALEQAKQERADAAQARREAADRARAEREAERAYRKSPMGQMEKLAKGVATSATRNLTNQLGRSLVRGVFGNLFKRK